MTPPLPASTTKHLPVVHHQIPRNDSIVLPLSQISSEAGRSTGTTGTTLWLGAQVLSAYLRDTLLTQASGSSGATIRRKKCVDLGSGVGYLPLCMAAMGWDVLATDIEPVVSSVLQPNVQAGLQVIHRELRRIDRLSQCGIVNVIELDWNDYLSPHQHSPEDDPPLPDPLEGDYLDLIITSDTLYTPSLTLPLWSTLTHFARLSQARHPRGKFPDLFIALENRDPGMIAAALEVGKEGWTMKRVADTRVQKGIEKAWGNGGEAWKRSDWEGVAVWKGKLG